MASHAIQTFGLGRSFSEEIDRILQVGRAKEVGTSVTLPAGIPEITLSELQSRFGQRWYKTWWFWTIAGTTVVGGLGVWYWRKNAKRSRK